MSAITTQFKNSFEIVHKTSQLIHELVYAINNFKKVAKTLERRTHLKECTVKIKKLQNEMNDAFSRLEGRCQSDEEEEELLNIIFIIYLNLSMMEKEIEND